MARGSRRRGDVSVTRLEDLRARYDALPSSEHLRDHLPDAATLETILGPMRVERSALLALDLDDLYSARWRGDAVCEAVRRAVVEAVRDAGSTEELDLSVVCGHRGRVRLVAVETEGVVTIRAGRDSVAACPTAST